MATTIRRRATVSLPTFAGSYGDAIVQSFDTYEDYLDSQITSTDLFYLEDVDLARQLVELGIPGITKGSKENFQHRKGFRRLSISKGSGRTRACSSTWQYTIIFIRDYNQIGHEVSGYIDYGERLKTEDLEPVFDRKRRLLPMPYDLSYYNWVTRNSYSNSSSNYQVVADSADGLLFKNKKDRKILNVDPNGEPGDNSTRTTISTVEYKQVVLYDHSNRKRV